MPDNGNAGIGIEEVLSLPAGRIRISTNMVDGARDFHRSDGVKVQAD